jgi:hypothetical protein
MRIRLPLSEPRPWERVVVGIFAGAVAAGTVFALIAVSYSLIAYDTFDFLGYEGGRLLFIAAPILAGLVSAFIGAFWPDLLVRALGRLWDAVVGVLRWI